MTFALDTHPIQRLRLYVPEYGVATADADLSDGATLTGSASLVAGDLTLRGVVQGAPIEGAGLYSWTAGAGLWGTVVAPKGYQSALGVLRSNVLADLTIAIATATGGATETLAVGLPDTRLGGVGSAYVRPAGPAWHTLRALRVPWWVDAAGVTQIKERPSAPAPVASVDVLKREPGSGVWIVAPRDQSYAAWLPGNTVDGERITSTLILANSGEPVRLELTTDAAGPPRDLRNAIAGIVAQNTDLLRFHGIYEYQVKAVVRESSDLIPVSQGIGLPPLSVREAKPGVPGFSSVLQNNQIVSIGFENGDPALPYIRGYEPRYKSVPSEVQLDASISVKMGDGAALVARQNDPVLGITATVLTDAMTSIVTMTLTDAGIPPATVVITFPPGTVAAPPNASLSSYKIGVPTQIKVRA
jgi:hypothetical protein